MGVDPITTYPSPGMILQVRAKYQEFTFLQKALLLKCVCVCVSFLRGVDAPCPPLKDKKDFSLSSLDVAGCLTIQGPEAHIL